MEATPYAVGNKSRWKAFSAEETTSEPSGDKIYFALSLEDASYLILKSCVYFENITSCNRSVL